jgi:hypothetical protein
MIAVPDNFDTCKDSCCAIFKTDKNISELKILCKGQTNDPEITRIDIEFFNQIGLEVEFTYSCSTDSSGNEIYNYNFYAHKIGETQEMKIFVEKYFDA